MVTSKIPPICDHVTHFCTVDQSGASSLIAQSCAIIMHTHYCSRNVELTSKHYECALGHMTCRASAPPPSEYFMLSCQSFTISDHTARLNIRWLHNRRVSSRFQIYSIFVQICRSNLCYECIRISKKAKAMYTCILFEYYMYMQEQ